MSDLHLLRHDADVGCVAAVVSEAIEAKTVAETPEQHDIVFEAHIRAPTAATAAPATATTAATATATAAATRTPPPPPATLAPPPRIGYRRTPRDCTAAGSPHDWLLCRS